MNYTLQKVNCKVLFGVAISLAAAFIFSVQAYAYEMVLIPNFVLDNNYVYVAKGVSPRTASLSSVSISYDSLADLVYYCNEHGLSTSLVYNSAVDAYVGWVNDSAINITGFSYTTLNGLLGNNAGKVYVAQDSNSAGTGDINSPSHWMSFSSISPVISPVSYDALCRIVLDLNAVQHPAEITTYSYGNTTYYVVISDGGRSAGKYYCSLDGRIYAIPADKADISLTIQVWCYQIKNKLVGLSDYIQNTLDSKLDTLTSVISNGKVLVDNSDVVSAIQSIPAFDDTEITGYVGSITEWLNLFSRKYDGNYTNMLQQVTFLNESLDLLRKHVITGNRHTSEIIDMLTAAVDADTGNLLVADTAVTSAIADLTDSLSVPTGKCAHDWQLTSTGQPGTPAVTNVRLPAEYQEVEYLENTSEGAYINTGAVPSLSGTKFHIKYQMLSGSYLFGCGRNPRLACAMRPYSIQFFIGGDGSPSVVNYTLAGIFSKVVAFSGYLTGSETGRYLDITVDGTTSRFIPPDGAISGSFSDSLPFYLFAWRYGDTLRSGTGRIWGFSMEVGGNLIRDMVPCYRKADNVPGFYDLVSGSFSTNAGTGSFVTGADVPVTIVTPEIPTNYDTYTCSICGEKYVDYNSAGAPEVTGVTIPFTRWFHGKFQEYEASLLSAIDAIPAYDDAAVIAAIQSIPAPTDYTSQLTAVVEKLDALLAKSNETVVNVINDNTYVPGVLYLDDNNSAVDTTKDGVSLFGGLVRWLWKNVFDGAFDAADITKLDGLFYDPAAAAEEVPDGS